MLRRIRLFASFSLTVAALALVGPSAQAAGSAGDFIQARQTQVTSLLHQGQGAQRDKQVAAVLEIGRAHV